MSFSRCNLHFREVEDGDLPLLREQRNTSWQGYRDPTPIMTMHQQKRWYSSLGPGNLAFIVENHLAPPVVPVGLLRIANIDKENRSADITGVDVFHGHNGKGYGVSICRGAAEWLLHDLGFHRVKGECTEGNIAMKKGLEKAGFTLEGKMRERIWRCGQWHDFLQYSILEQELWPEGTKGLEGL